MLAEIALTPQVFDEPGQADAGAWVEQLRELGRWLLPQFGPNPLVIADLHGGTWFRQLAAAVKGIQDHRARDLARRLLPVVERMLVTRPPCSDYPEGEDEWAREAIVSSGREPIDRIIVTPEAYARAKGTCDALRCAANLGDWGFWDGISPTWSPAMVLDDQVRRMRPLCVHAGFIALVNPYSLASEADFTRALVRSALRRPDDFPPVGLVDVHAAAEGTDAAGLADLRTILSDELRHFWTGPGTFRLFIWPKFLNRIVLAGDVHRVEKGLPRPKVRWGVSLSHVASARDPAGGDPAPWGLLSAKEAGDAFARLYGETATASLRCDPVVIEGRS